ncbi:hypothetical protein [Cytobacillus purgationiresistens]|uniref:L-asparagine transporter-like permease n=1 Tax=Cytobacillus purgationiresistens TaxID=863449 RepID=A0ABU0AD43_9BACI|nr:hypothetical protein [Cytobacillus purgationiresistens]MDQ0268353.1 L-asparagine transporter-like permease [Cytobacillus purgationiresistens]
MRNKDEQGYVRSFIFFGSIFFIIGVIILLIGNQEILGAYTSLFALSFMCFCLAYLYPQIKENDERAQKIREKAMYNGYIFLMVYIIIFMFLFRFNLIQLDGSQTINLLSCLIIVTLFSNLVVLAKR